MRSRTQINSYPVHPKLVVFPLGLFFGSWISDLIGKATRQRAALGGQLLLHDRRLVGAFCAAIPGLIDRFTVVAFSDHCTHKGGPLTDGVLIGRTVQCPWHGSQFDTHTGRVIAGPAKNKIDVYNIDIRGEVYIQSTRKQQPKAA